MSEQLTNAAQTTLNGSVTNVATTLVVTSATGFPATGDFRCIISAEGANTDEIVKVTAVSGTTFTITRASEPYAGVQTASAHASGATITHVITADTLYKLGLAAGFIGVRALRGTAQSIVTSTWDDVDFTSADTFDTDVFHDTGVNPERVTIPAGLAGKYLILGFTYWAANATGVRYISITKNGTRQGDYPLDAVNTVNSPNTQTEVMELVAGDYIGLQVHQTSGGNLDVSGRLTLIKLDAGRVGTGIGARVTNSGNVSGTDATYTSMTFDTEVFDTDGFHSTSSNTSRFTIPAGLGGTYLVQGTIQWVANATGVRFAAIAKNGTNDTPSGPLTPSSSFSNRLPTYAVLQLVAGDYVEVKGYQNSGGALNMESGSVFSIMRLDSIPANDNTFQVETTAGAIVDTAAVKFVFDPEVATALTGHSVQIRGLPSGTIGCRVYNSTTQSITTGTGPPLTFDTEEFDTDGFHSTSSLTSRITVPAGLAGKYLITGGTQFAASGAGTYRIIAVTKNGVAVPPHMRRGVAPTDPAFALSVVLDLLVGDYVEIIAYQDSGGNLNVGHASTAEFRSTLSAVKLDSGRVGTGIGASAYATAGTSIANNSSVPIDLAGEEFDTDGFHSTSSNTSRMTIPAGLAGKYLAVGQISWDTNVTGERILLLMKNGTGFAAGQPTVRDTTTDTQFSQQGTGVFDLVAGDYIQLTAYQSSGGTRDIDTSSPSRTWLKIMRIDSSANVHNEENLVYLYF